jgi:DNA-binding NarL/FixJ family response regulator
MRELFSNTPKLKSDISRSDYLRFDGARARVQAVVHDEIDRLGIEEVLKSRGARVVKFDVALFNSETPQLAISESADVIIVVEPEFATSSDDILMMVKTVAVRSPESRILVITDIRSEIDVLAELSSSVSAPSAHNLRSASIDADTMLQSVQELALGEPGSLLPLAIDNRSRLAETASRIIKLTRRELEILEYVAQGISNKQIAGALNLSLRTVNNHVGMMFMKLGVASNPDINARVSASLAFCIYSRALTGKLLTDTLVENSRGVISSTEYQLVESDS